MAFRVLSLLLAVVPHGPWAHKRKSAKNLCQLAQKSHGLHCSHSDFTHLLLDHLGYSLSGKSPVCHLHSSRLHSPSSKFRASTADKTAYGSNLAASQAAGDTASAGVGASNWMLGLASHRSIRAGNLAESRAGGYTPRKQLFLFSSIT